MPYTRVYPDKDGKLTITPGSSNYGKRSDGTWVIAHPTLGMVNTENMQTKEFEDGTMSVIGQLFIGVTPGYFTAGDWRLAP